MKMKNMLLFLLLAGSITIGFAQEKAPEVKTIVVKDSVQDKILERLDSIYELQNSIQEERKADLESFQKNSKDLTEKRRSDISVMSDIAKNTEEDFVESGWTLFALLTFFISLAVSLFTSWSQWRTEQHTKNVSIGSQLGVLDDLPRHFYRNLVCTVAMLIRYRHADNRNTATGTFRTYPSEANVMKLQTLPEEFILPIDMGTDKVFDEMHEQKLLFKNYNIEVASASEHFSRKHIREKSLVNDFDNLLFKPIYLITRLCNLYEMLKNSKEWTRNEYVYNVICTFVMEHFCKLSLGEFKYGMQGKYLQDIMEETDFVKYIRYDMSTPYDSGAIYSNGIERSTGMLLGLYKKCEPKPFISGEDDKYVIEAPQATELEKLDFISVKDGKYMIDSSTFKEYFQKVKEEEIIEKKKEDIVNEVLNCKNIDKVMDDYSLTGTAYADAIRSYLEFWQKDEWDLKELLYNMLRMDAISELPLIGMIEHEA